MTKLKKPIALEAYETLAERYAALVDTKPENAYYERPATPSLLPDVRTTRLSMCECQKDPAPWTLTYDRRV